jgi:hypothetical protein
MRRSAVTSLAIAARSPRTNKPWNLHFCAALQARPRFRFPLRSAATLAGAESADLCAGLSAGAVGRPDALKAREPAEARAHDLAFRPEVSFPEPADRLNVPPRFRSAGSEAPFAGFRPFAAE